MKGRGYWFVVLALVVVSVLVMCTGCAKQDEQTVAFRASSCSTAPTGLTRQISRNTGVCLVRMAKSQICTMWQTRMVPQRELVRTCSRSEWVDR